MFEEIYQNFLTSLGYSKFVTKLFGKKILIFTYFKHYEKSI